MVEQPHRQDYGTPTADQVNPKTGLTPNQEQLARNRRLAQALNRFAQALDRLHARNDQ